MTTSSAVDAVAVVHRYVKAFNAGDVDAMSACFTDDGCILDGMAPHLWRGATAPQDWYEGVLAEGRHQEAGGWRVTLSDAVHHDVSGDAAYVVMPATMTFDHRGRNVTQTGSFFTAALAHSDGVWRIRAWSWTKGRS
ncbi:DUF4440 domain-containing protein [Mycobacterium sp. PS03-16]|uniref:YybH family protein n=1 Tax=Mycobacterium sp. PS03-16 TaxID=2559611 RepID=UPI001074398B|nr:nuclear transport factor 2 family protein [Mycobacterium sp. PS03-16]TFV56825.1 DUF4440 domain-containing protein [Mycobacterium sp. PS03-16]